MPVQPTRTFNGVTFTLVAAVPFYGDALCMVRDLSGRKYMVPDDEPNAGTEYVTRARRVKSPAYLRDVGLPFLVYAAEVAVPTAEGEQG